MSELLSNSFLGLEGLHVFITGAAGGIGSEVVREFIRNGCRVTAHDRKQIAVGSFGVSTDAERRILTVCGDLSSEASIEACFYSAVSHFGPVNVLIANAGITDESNSYPIWDLPVELWDQTYTTNVRGTYLTIKHFLRSVKDAQEKTGKATDNVSIVVTGSECGKFGQAGHGEYASGKAGLMYGLVRTVKNEIIKLNSRARINAVAPGWVNTDMIKGRLDDPKVMWEEAQATVPLQKIAQPTDVARAMAFLASHRAAGHVSGECLSVDGGMEGRLIWKPDEVEGLENLSLTPAPASLPVAKAPEKRRKRMRVAITVDFDAVSGYLGTGQVPSNGLSDYSAGLLSAHVGVPRLLKLFKKYGMSDKVSWFIPGHSMESFPEQTKAIVESGAEIGIHNYSHEGAYQMTPTQERAVLEKCVSLCTGLTGKKPMGYRAPMYQIRETTVELLREFGFSYDSSLNAHDSIPYYLPKPMPEPPVVPDFEKMEADEWMVPLPKEYSQTMMNTAPSGDSTDAARPLVEIPGSWYSEDLTPLGFYPYTPNSQGYVSVDVIERMWWDRWNWLWENEASDSDSPFAPKATSGSNGPSPGDSLGCLFPLILHPEAAGRAHIIGMIERIIQGVVKRAQDAEASGEGVISFERMEDIASDFRAMTAN